MKKVLILTSGGDSSGMNVFIKAFAKLCKKHSIELVASLYGYQGLVDNNFEKLDYDNMAYIENVGGSIIKSARSKDFLSKEGFATAVENIKKQNAECVVVIGGNGTINGSIDLKNAGVKVVAVPGTIDNDMIYTDFTLGFDTACQNSAKLVNNIKQSMDTFGRGLIAEVMGRDCADIALRTSIITNADMCIFENQSAKQIAEEIKSLIAKGVDSPLVIVKEHLFDIEALAQEIEKLIGKEFRAVKVGYAQRGGEPSNTDKILAIKFAFETMKNIENSNFGVAVGQQSDNIISVEVEDAVKSKKFYSENLKELFLAYK